MPSVMVEPVIGRPCVRCGSNERYPKSGKCIACNRGWIRRADPDAVARSHQRRADWVRRNPSLVREYKATYKQKKASVKNSWLKSKYGITLAEFEDLLRAQHSQCRICRSTVAAWDGDGALGAVVDHDHGTGHVRGLLCRLCNAGIGALRDSRQNLSRAITYLNQGEEGECGYA